MQRSACCGFVVMILVAGFLPGGPAAAAGQWRFDAQAGQLHYEGAPEANATSVGLALSRSAALSSFGVSAGVPFSSDEPVWGALHGYRRLVTGGSFRVGADLGANAFGYRIGARDSTDLLPLPEDNETVTGWGGSVEVLPLASWTTFGMKTEARAGFVGFRTSSSHADAIERVAFMADGLIERRIAGGLTGRIEGRWVRVSEGGFPFAGLGLVWTSGPTVWASVGRWFDETVESVSWNGGASIPLGDRLALMLTGARDPLDPIYATPARTTWAVGLSLWLGENGRNVPPPIPASYEDGIATIALDDDDVSGTPSIAGDFNAWSPEPMIREGDDWVLRVPLAPGVYNYSFVDESGNWFVPEDTPGRRDDGMGGWVAVLVVTE